MKSFYAILAITLVMTLFAADEPPPPFVIATIGGDTVSGPLRELKADWSMRVGDKTLGANEIVSLRRANGKLPPFPVEAHVLLGNGDRIPVVAPRLNGDNLLFTHPALGDGKAVSLPLTAIVLLWLAPPEDIEQPDRLRRQLADATRTRDHVLLRNGDVVEGVFNALDAKRASVELNKRTIDVTLDKIAAIALSSDGVSKQKPKGVYARVVLADGTRMTLTSATSNGVTLQGTTSFGAGFTIPLARVAAFDLMQGAVVYLSELKPAKFEQTAFLGNGGVKWPLAIDAAVTGRDLRLGGSVYDHGLGMHSRSRATYTLDGKYHRFEAVVGLDDESGRDGSVRVRVFADGKALDLGKTGELTAKNGPLVVNVRIEGVKELTLEADFGARGDVQGHVDWAEARVVK